MSENKPSNQKTTLTTIVHEKNGKTTITHEVKPKVTNSLGSESMLSRPTKPPVVKPKK